MSTYATRTVNPLPFQDLDPKRFEDLTRQLVYEFKPWRRLEATGRSGADDGFDARGLEIIDLGVNADEDRSEETEDADPVLGDRLWLVQCKREKAIGPAKLKRYLAEISLAPEEKLYGVIFVAACDFSKSARDLFFSWARGSGISEAHIWGKGELEDMLFQPRNDNLLFAYFGISLTIRRRSIATQVRADLAIKRKLAKTVLTSSAEVLVRDPSADDYPMVDEGKLPEKWWVYRPEELSYLGLMLSIGWSYAYFDHSNGEWDAADVVRSVRPDHPWTVDDEKRDVLDREAREFCEALPSEHRAWLNTSGAIPLRNILAIDELGDDIFKGPHLYVPFTGKFGPFEGQYVRLTTRHAYDAPMEAAPEKRVARFPAHLRRV
jgi:hypothetical protein